MSHNNRILLYDILRGIAVVWIIGIWHLTNYNIENSSLRTIYESRICQDITTTILALFMFISGIFNSKLVVKDSADAKLYYKHKLIRFYPLYLLAIALSLYADWQPVLTIYDKGIVQVLLSIFGLATVFNIAPSTLWFMDLLLFFMIMTPIIKYLNRWRIMFIMFVWILIWSLSRFTHAIDSRVALYFPFYAFGVCLNPNRVCEFFKRKWQILLIIFGFISLSIFMIPSLKKFPLNIYIYIFSNISVLLCIGLFIEYIACKSRIIGGLFINLAYLSLSAYLFHRIVLKAGLLLGLNLYILPIIVFIVSYFIQNGYDKSIRHIIK